MIIWLNVAGQDVLTLQDGRLQNRILFPQRVGHCGARCSLMSDIFSLQGRKFGSAGQTQNWWTPGDVARFTHRANCIKHFYSSYTVMGRKVNGELTLVCVHAIRS